MKFIEISMFSIKFCEISMILDDIQWNFDEFWWNSMNFKVLDEILWNLDDFWWNSMKFQWCWMKFDEISMFSNKIYEVSMILDEIPWE